MAAGEEPSTIYALREGVRIFRNGEEIRLRKGVWSYNEAVVRLPDHGERTGKFFELVYEALVRDQQADASMIGAAVGATEEELASYCELLESLRSQQFLQSPKQKDIWRMVNALFGGNVGGFEDRAGATRPVLFFSDSHYAEDAARTLAREIGLPLDVMDDETKRGLAAADLTTRTDAVAYAETMARFERAIQPIYSCVVGCVASPNLSQLRNLNRVLVRLERPLILGLIDGPFVSLVSTLATETGCFECFEQRMLARLEDTVVYHRFVESAAMGSPPGGPTLSPALHMLTGAVISEAYLYSTIGMQRLAGRIVNIYLPLLEIQVQDLLRVPYCPACGFMSTARMDEMYTSTKKLVSDMLEKIQIEG
jgi:thiazole/oxazole-forming peptide maturase SagC family component